MPDFSRQSIFDSEELSALELAGKVAQKLNDAITLINSGVASIAGKEDITDLTTNRKLSATGNFTGLLNGESILQVQTDIASSLSLVNELEILVNNSRESLGYIFDGGLFTQSGTDFSIDGGAF
jgi:hypothetical protein